MLSDVTPQSFNDPFKTTRLLIIGQRAPLNLLKFRFYLLNSQAIFIQAAKECFYFV